MSSKSDLKRFLEQISENAKFVKFDYTSSETFSITLKCRVASNQTSEFYNQRTKQWLQKFSKFTSTNWIARQSFTNLTKLLLYRKLYVCHRPELKTKSKNHGKSKHQQCNAKIDFKVKFIKRGPMKRDPYLKEGLNLNIFIDFIHSHDVRTALTYRVLQTSDETDQIFYRYFNMGCSVAVAKYIHGLMLNDKYGEDSKESQSSYINPTFQHIVYIHKKWRNGKRDNLIEIVTEMKLKLNNDGGFLNFDENLTTAVIITPLMKRVIEAFALETAHIDRTNVSNGLIITILYVPTNVALLPIAYIVQNQTDEFAFNISIDSIKTYIRINCGKQFEPNIVTINSTEEQFKNMEATFFNSKMYKSFTAMCREIWHWICLEDNRISYKKRHEVLTSLQRLLRAQDLEIAEKIYTELNDTNLVNWLPNLKALVESLWQRRDQWFDTEICYQRNKLVDISLRTTAQFFLSRCRTFNVYLMVDVVSNILDNQWREMINALITRKNLVSIFTKHLAPSSTILKKGSQIKPFRDELRFALNSRKSIHLNVHNWRCDCQQGRKDQFCEHLTAILSLHADVGRIEVSREDRNILIGLVDAAPEDSSNEMSDEDSDSQNLVIDESYAYTDDENQEMSSEPKSPEETMEDDETESFQESKTDENYYYIEKGVDHKKAVNDDLNSNKDDTIDVSNSNDEDNSSTETAEDTPTQSPMSPKGTYEGALRKLNTEFRRLNKFFKENPNNSNLATIDRLAKELAKIRPIERVDLTNIYLKSNVNNNAIQ